MESIKNGVQAVVSEIYQKKGEIRPSELVEAARPEASPAHNAFEWDDSKAGEEYRLQQARRWIRLVRIEVEDRQERFIHVPQINSSSSINESGEGYYKPISVVTKDAFEYEAALNATRVKLSAAEAAYRELREAATDSCINFKRADKGFKMVAEALG